MSNAHILTSSAAPAQPAAADEPARAQVVASAIAALGAVLLWGVGFSHAEAVHNAAHDTRHSNGFPGH